MNCHEGVVRAGGHDHLRIVLAPRKATRGKLPLLTIGRIQLGEGGQNICIIGQYYHQIQREILDHLGADATSAQDSSN